MAGVLGHPGSMRLHQAGMLPTSRQLAGLGTVLCLYRTQHGSELAGWHQAVRVEACTGVDSDGLNESLLFFDAEDRCCWRLFLLPDSDFVAWDRLLGSLPARSESACGSLGERLWRRLAGRLLSGQWRACALRLHAVPQEHNVQARVSPSLAASLATVSPLGVATARRIALAEGAEADTSIDDCCCAGSHFPAGPRVDAKGAGDDNAIPLVRLK
ncbi:Hemin transport protein [Pseudoxanthomonas putridarboris]|uniref:Hemin transport protein n=1 Tax=Pseudoxanthomonas putridarboris TaxID=752605 RepID=A0ABU9IX67_9GAMM